jgi:hypothetical protein
VGNRRSNRLSDGGAKLKEGPNFRCSESETPQIHVNTQLDAILKGYDFLRYFGGTFRLHLQDELAVLQSSELLA